MGSFRQENWCQLPCLPREDLPNAGIEPALSAFQTDYSWAPGGAQKWENYVNKFLLLPPSFQCRVTICYSLSPFRAVPESSNVLAKLVHLGAVRHEVVPSLAMNSCWFTPTLPHFAFLTRAVPGWVSPSKLLCYHFYLCPRLSFLEKLGNDSSIFLVFWDNETSYHLIFFVFLNRIETLGD